MSAIGGLGFPGVNQQPNTQSQSQDVDTTNQTDTITNAPPTTNEADTDNQTGNDTPQQNTSSTGNSTASTNNTSNTNAVNSDATGSSIVVQRNEPVVAKGGTAPETAQSIVEFKLSEPASEQQVQDVRTAALEAQRAYQLQSFVEKLSETPRAVDLGEQARSDSAEQATDQSNRTDAEQVAVAPLAPDFQN